MKRTLLFLGALWLACGSPAAPKAHAQIIAVFSQNGPDVVVTVSGQANTTGLTVSSFGSNSFGLISPSQRLFSSNSGAVANYLSALSGSGGFGTGGLKQASFSSGSTVGFFNRDLFLPFNYVSNTAVSASSTYSGATYTTLGLTPGTYTYTWAGGSFSSGQAIQIQILAAIPEVGSLTSGATVIGIGLGTWGLRRRRSLRGRPARI